MKRQSSIFRIRNDLIIIYLESLLALNIAFIDKEVNKNWLIYLTYALRCRLKINMMRLGEFSLNQMYTKKNIENILSISIEIWKIFKIIKRETFLKNIFTVRM